MLSQKTIYEGCLSTWEAEDDRIEVFKKRFDNWIDKFDGESKQVVLTLLKHFNYYSKSRVNQYLIKHHNYLISNHSLSNEATIYTPITSDHGRGNSSTDYVVEYKNINNVNKFCWINEIEFLSDKVWEVIENIVLVDDCCGSGKTACTFIEKYNHLFKHKKIYLITVHAMKQALEKIGSLCDEYEIEFTFICDNIKDKGICEAYRKLDEQEKNRKVLHSGCEELDIKEKFILGKYDSESLMAFYNNSPNNNYGIFWIDKRDYESPFPRKFDKKPKWSYMKNDKSTRKVQNYNSNVVTNG